MAPKAPVKLYFLSFCDPAKPKGSQFLGACLVEGIGAEDERDDKAGAVRNAWRLKCNPGGEVACQEVPESMTKHVDASWRHRLLSREECAAFDRAHMRFKPS